MAIRIQREVGGNLSEILMTVAETMTQRERLRREVNALTAEGRISAIVLGVLPPGIAIVMYVINAEYIRTLGTGIGPWIVGAAVVVMLGGFYWMSRIIKIEV
jgi:tight adherence protein B